jgi:hypothetical protein
MAPAKVTNSERLLMAPGTVAALRSAVYQFSEELV